MITLAALVGCVVLFLCGIGVGYSLDHRRGLRVSDSKRAELNGQDQS